MKVRTLLAVAVAAAFAVPLGTLAQGTGGTTTAPSASQPQGSPPASSSAGSQADKSATGTMGSDRPMSGATGSMPSFESVDKNHDGNISRAEWDEYWKSRGGAAGGTSTPSTSGAGASTPPASSPSSGGPASSTGSSAGGSPASPATPKEPK